MMPEKLSLQWNNFKENAMSAFGNMRHDKEALTYVTRKITFYVIDIHIYRYTYVLLDVYNHFYNSMATSEVFGSELAP